MKDGQLFQRLLMKGRIRQLQMVAVVAQSGSMQQAARRLSVSQPAITKVVAELETELGLALFERHARGIRLTRSGRHVLPLLERILAATEEFSEAVDLHRNFGASVLRVASVAPLTILGLEFASLIGNAFIVEFVFSWPGIASYGVRTILQKDLNAVIGVVLVSGVFFVVANLTIDLVLGILDPRHRIRAGRDA